MHQVTSIPEVYERRELTWSSDAFEAGRCFQEFFEGRSVFFFPHLKNNTLMPAEHPFVIYTDLALIYPQSWSVTTSLYTRYVLTRAWGSSRRPGHQRHCPSASCAA